MLWASKMCTWGLWSRLYSRQLPLVYTPRSVRKNVYSRLPFHFPHPHTSLPPLPLPPSPSLSLTFIHLVLSRFLLAVLIRFTSAMLFARPLYTPAIFFFMFPIYRPSASHISFSSFLPFLSLPAHSEDFGSPSWRFFFSFSGSLNFDTSSQVVVKMHN